MAAGKHADLFRTHAPAGSQVNPRRTLVDLLRPTADRNEADHALLAPSRAPMTYGALRQQSAATVAVLRRADVGRQDRVAVVLPNGPEMAAASFAIASGAVCAPLNPGYGEDELRFFLTDLRPGGAGAVRPTIADPPARSQPRSACAASMRDGRDDWPAGRIALDGGDAPACADDAPPHPDDVALLLHTSGTTSRPKLVPAVACQSVQLGPQHRPDPGALSPRPLPQHDAAVPHPRLRRRAARVIRCRRQRCLLPRISRRFLPAMARCVAADLVYRSAHRASGDPRRTGAPSGRRGRASSALRALLVGPAARGGSARARIGAAGAGDRGVRNDRGRAPDCQQPAAARPATGELGRLRGGPVRGDHGRPAAPAAGGRDRGDRHPRRQCHRRLPEPPRGQFRRVCRRLVPHRRPGIHRRRGLPPPHGPAEGDHQPGRREGVALRGGPGPARARRGPPGGDLRRAPLDTRRRRRCRGGPAGWRDGDRGGDPRIPVRTSCRIQDPQPARRRRRDSRRRHRQDPAHRPRRPAGRAAAAGLRGATRCNGAGTGFDGRATSSA